MFVYACSPWDAVLTHNTVDDTQPYFQAAQLLVTEFLDNPDSWTRVDAILQFSINPVSKVCLLSTVYA